MFKFPLFFLVLIVLSILVWVFSYRIFFQATPTQDPAFLAVISSSPTSTTVTTPPLSIMSANIKNSVEIQAWIYPGDPACDAKLEYSDGRKIDILKPEYFTLSESGELVLLTDQVAGCNGYSFENVVSIKKHSKWQYVTFSSNYSVSMDAFLTRALSSKKDIDTIVSLVVLNNMTGVEIDFEDFGGWNDEMYSKYKQFITQLGNELHYNNKKLMIVGPATSNQAEEDWYVWRYADFVALPVDRIVIMTYDYQFDQGVGEPVSPIGWIKSTIKWTLSKYPYNKKITFGIPSYGYKGTIGSQNFSLLTFNQIKKEPGFDTAMRDPNSFEMTWQHEGNVYFYQDSQSMSKKLQTIANSGIPSISVWHLGGNKWFTKK